LVVRAEVGRLPCDRLPRPRPPLPAESRPEAARALLPGAAFAPPREPPRTLRGRRGDRDRARRRARLRGAADAAASGGLAGGEARRGDAGVLRRLRSPRGGGRSAGATAVRSPCGSRARARGRPG